MKNSDERLKVKEELEKIAKERKIELVHNLSYDKSFVKDSVLRKIKNAKNILVYGDSDVDGVTSTAIMVYTLRKIGKNVEWFIPKRRVFGVVDKYVKNYNFDLLIALDSGSYKLPYPSAVIDHHLPQSDFQDLINPKTIDKNNILATCGITWITANELTDVKECLDLVAIGTVADMCELNQENHNLCHLGFHMLNDEENKRVAFENYGTIGASDVSFWIAPRINAYCDENGKELVTLLLTESRIEANLIWKNINKLYDEVKKKRQEAAIEIEPVVGDIVYAICKEKEYCGILANHLSNMYNKPALVIYEDGEVLSGSGRIPDVKTNFRDTLQKYAQKLQGHYKAFAVELEKRDFNNFLKQDIYVEQIEFTHDVNATFADCINREVMETLSDMSPFGVGNPKPVFLTHKVKVLEKKEFRNGFWTGKLSDGTKSVMCKGFGGVPKENFFEDFFYTVSFSKEYGAQVEPLK